MAEILRWIGISEGYDERAYSSFITTFSETECVYHDTSIVA